MSIDEHIKEAHASKGTINLGGASVPLAIEDHAFLVANRNSEHFKVFARCIRSYKEFIVNRLALCSREDLQAAQGQLQGINCALNILEMAMQVPVSGTQETEQQARKRKLREPVHR